MPDLWLDPVSPVLRPQALEAFAARDVVGFLISASNEYGLDLVLRNMNALLDAGMYEEALLPAFYMTRTNNARVSLSSLRWLFEMADRKRLLAAGDPLPEGERFTLYRGVAGKGRRRRVRGLSWTDDRERAEWFAKRFSDLADPAVFSVTVDRSDIYAFSNERKECEYIVLLPNTIKPKRVQTAPADPGSGRTRELTLDPA